MAKDLIRETNPLSIVETHTVKAEHETRVLLENLVRNCDLVVCATDSRPSKLFTNALCVEADRTVIFGGAFSQSLWRASAASPPTPICLLSLVSS